VLAQCQRGDIFHPDCSGPTVVWRIRQPNQRVTYLKERQPPLLDG
jgi:hypothetical protein